MAYDASLVKLALRCAHDPFEWGRFDCMLIIADRLLTLSGEDCAAHLRGEYHDSKSCHALTGVLRDPIGLVESCVSRIEGVTRVDVPQSGDVGVIQADEGTVGAVFNGRHWFTVGEDGLIVGEPSAVLAAWRYECPH